MSTVVAVHRVIRLARHLRGGQALDSSERDALADDLDAYLLGRVADLDEALGLRAAPGERDWRTTLALSERDDLLRKAAVRFYPDLPTAAQAEELHRALKHYAGSAWTHERTWIACREWRRGRIEEVCWHVLRLHDRVLSAAHLRRILRTS